MRRRHFLATVVGSVAALAGCTAGDGDETTAPSSSDGTAGQTGDPSGDPAGGTERGAPETTGSSGSEPAVTISDPRMRADVVAPTDVHRTVVAFSEGQYLVVTLDGPSAVDPERLSLVAGDRTVAESAFALSRNETERPVDVAFPVPYDPVPTDPRILVETSGGSTEWAVPSATVEQLARPARLELVEFSVPDATTDGAVIDVELGVRNDGDRDGTFRALLGTYDPGSVNRTIASVDVPAGESASTTVELRASDSNSDGDVVVFLDRDGERTRTVPVEQSAQRF